MSLVAPSSTRASLSCQPLSPRAEACARRPGKPPRRRALRRPPERSSSSSTRRSSTSRNRSRAPPRAENTKNPMKYASSVALLTLTHGVGLRGLPAKKDETPHHQHGYPNAESRGLQSEEQQPDARAYHHFFGHERHGGPHRVQAGVGEQGVRPHLDADAQRVEQGRRDAHVEDHGLR